jgi:hypothetical protein
VCPPPPPLTLRGKLVDDSQPVDHHAGTKPVHVPLELFRAPLDVHGRVAEARLV